MRLCASLWIKGLQNWQWAKFEFRKFFDSILFFLFWLCNRLCFLSFFNISGFPSVHIDCKYQRLPVFPSLCVSLNSSEKNFWRWLKESLFVIIDHISAKLYRSRHGKKKLYRANLMLFSLVFDKDSAK